MSDFGPTNPHDTLSGGPPSSATSEPSAGGQLEAAPAPRHLPRQPLRTRLVGLGAHRRAGSPGHGHADGWRTEDVDGSWRQRGGDVWGDWTLRRPGHVRLGAIGAARVRQRCRWRSADRAAGRPTLGLDRPPVGHPARSPACPRRASR